MKHAKRISRTALAAVPQPAKKRLQLQDRAGKDLKRALDHERARTLLIEAEHARGIEMLRQVALSEAKFYMDELAESCSLVDAMMLRDLLERYGSVSSFPVVIAELLHDVRRKSPSASVMS